MNLKGLTTKALLNKDIRDYDNLSNKELRQVLRKLGNTLNRRIRSIERSGLNSPALDGLSKRGPKEIGSKHLGTKKDDHKALMKELERALRFGNAKTSTIKGIKGYRKHLDEHAAHLLGWDINDGFNDKRISTMDEIFETANKLIQINYYIYQVLKSEVYREVNKVYNVLDLRPLTAAEKQQIILNHANDFLEIVLSNQHYIFNEFNL